MKPVFISKSSWETHRWVLIYNYLTIAGTEVHYFEHIVMALYTGGKKALIVINYDWDEGTHGD